MKRQFSYILLTLLMVAACTKPSPSGPSTWHDPKPTPSKISVSSIKLSLSDIEMEEGNVATLRVEITPSNATDKSVQWSISDDDILAFDESTNEMAKVVGLKAGRATVTVKTVDGGISARCSFRITMPDIPGGDPDPDPDPDPTPDPVPVNIKYHSYYELPTICDNNSDNRDDSNSTLVYAQHHFSYNSQNMRNYTVCFSTEHHCPVWVAAPRHSVYTGNTGRTETYKSDPIIEKVAPGAQYTSTSAGNSCNKGHMLGSAERTCCTSCNNQVFYFSNIAPQEGSGFNTGSGGWNLLEDYVDGKVCSDTLYVVIGCYFDKFTDGYGNTVEPKKISYCGRNDVSYPTMFYYILLRTKSGKSGKALKNCSASELMCAAFVRSHTNSLKGQKVSSKEMMSVAALEKITGFTYFENVPNAPKSILNTSDWGL